MNKTLSALSLLIALLAAHQAFGQKSRLPIPKLTEQVDQLKKLHSGVADVAVRQQLISGLDKLISGYLERCHVSAKHRQPASRADVIKIENSMRAMGSSKQRLLVLSVALQSHYLKMDDARGLVTLIEGSADRVEALKALYPRLVDRRQFHALLTLVERAEDLEALLRTVNATEVSTAEDVEPAPVNKD